MDPLEKQIQELDLNIKSLDNSKYLLTHEWWKNIARSDFYLRQTPQTETLRISTTAKQLIVELGVYEGGSVCWFSEHFLDHPESRLIAIDPFTGSAEHQDPNQYPELKNLELTARKNIYKSKNAEKISIIKDCSQTVYPEIAQKFEKQIDILYIDGDHSALGVMRDTCLYAPLVKSGGLIIWDDFGHAICNKAIESCIENEIVPLKVAAKTHWQLWARVK